MTKAENYWNQLTATLWFVPTIFVVGSILLAFLFVGIDYSVGERLGYFPRFFGIQPSGAKDMLAVIAGSTMTVAVTAFSITIVALTLASTQFSPRILRTFMRDSGSQIVLGILVGIFTYCIIVLRTIQDGGDNQNNSFVPSISVFFGIILGFVAVGCLIYFIHHVATSIQATSIVAHIAKETTGEIKRTFPTGEVTDKIDRETAEILAGKNFTVINAERTGYVQNADGQELVKLAEKYDLILTMQRGIGQFVIEGLPILQVYSRNGGFAPDAAQIKKLKKFYEIDDFRTVEGDVAFGLRQIVDIALKALSPAVNDTTTGIICVDYLSAILVCLAKRPSCSSYLKSNGKLRLIMEQQKFEDFFDLAFNQIRQNAGGNVAIILRQLSSLNVLSKINLELPSETEKAERHELFKTQAGLLYELAEKTIPAKADLQLIESYHRNIENLLSKREKSMESLA